MESFAEQRRTAILQELTQRRMVRIADLSERFSVSQLSIRRNLERLEQLGLLKRVHGGTVGVPMAAMPQTNSGPTHCLSKQKECIGRAAAALIRQGERLIFDSGTTVLQVAHNISGDLLTAGNLTVITTSFPVAQELGPWKGVHLLFLGSLCLPEYQAVVDQLNDRCVKVAARRPHLPGHRRPDLFTRRYHSQQPTCWRSKPTAPWSARRTEPPPSK